MLERIGTRLKNKKSVVLLFLLVPFFLFTASVVFSAKPLLYEKAEFSWLIRDRQGKLLWLSLSEDQKYRCFVPLKQIPQAVLEATLLYEDREFYEHSGVNFLSLGRAVYSMARGGRRIGASLSPCSWSAFPNKRKRILFSRKYGRFGGLSFMNFIIRKMKF